MQGTPVPGASAEPTGTTVGYAPKAALPMANEGFNKVNLSFLFQHAEGQLMDTINSGKIGLKRHPVKPLCMCQDEISPLWLQFTAKS